VVVVQDRVFARLLLQEGGDEYGIVAELDPSTSAVLGWRTAGRSISTLLSFGDRLLLLDDLNRVVDVDLAAFDDTSATPWRPSTATAFEPNDDERAAMDAFGQVYDLDANVGAVLAGIDDVDGLETLIPTVFETARAAGLHEFVARAAAVSGDEAWVLWDAVDDSGGVVVEGGVALLGRHEGVWKIRRTQLCADLAQLGSPCPPT
jgi:hypothetical protein